MLIVFAGSKQTGKSSSAKFLLGEIAKRVGIVEDYKLKDGELYFPFYNLEKNKNKEDVSYTESFYLTDKYNWFYKDLNKHCMILNFADSLKDTISRMFDIPIEYLHGSDEKKNMYSKVKWSDIQSLLDVNFKTKIKKENLYEKCLTNRQLMQIFGTNILRKFDNDCFINACLSDYRKYKPNLGLIADCRFENEVLKTKESGAILIRLKYKRENLDDHSSETEIQELPDRLFDLNIDNTNMTIDEKNKVILNFLKKKGI